MNRVDLALFKFEWLMKQPPVDDAQALAVRDKARNMPLLNGTIVSDDGKAICALYPDHRQEYQL